MPSRLIICFPQVDIHDLLEWIEGLLNLQGQEADMVQSTNLNTFEDIVKQIVDINAVCIQGKDPSSNEWIKGRGLLKVLFQTGLASLKE